MAMEICKHLGQTDDVLSDLVGVSFFKLAMHKAWPELFKRMQQSKVGTTPKDRQLVISARTWFCLYLFEHQYVLSRLTSEYEMS